MEIRTTLCYNVASWSNFPTLTGYEQRVRQRGEHGHEDWTEDGVEALRLSETQIRISEPDLDHEPSDALQSPPA